MAAAAARPEWFAAQLSAEGRGFAERLRAHLRAFPSKSFAASGLKLREAAVLAPLFWRGGEPWALLTRRPETLRQHPGQISFPGGGRDVGDATLLHTALRESEEEVGLEPDAVEVLGLLGAMPVITGYWVTPFVGLVPADAPLRPNPVEIAQVLEAPLWRLRRETRVILQAPREVLVWDEGTEAVWGATYRMLTQLLEHVDAIGRST